MKESILIQAWEVYSYKGVYYIEYTHFIYLETILKKYNKVYLVSPINIIEFEETKKLYKLSDNISIFEIPGFSSYISAYKNFFSYVKVYKKIKHINFDTVYSRFPSPFGWLQKIYFKGNRVVHYVGNPIDTLMKNPNLNFLNKIFKSLLFLPEYFLFIWSCYGKNVKCYSNGHHISNRIKKFNVNIKPMISTTLMESDFYKKEIKSNVKVNKLIYVGYLRKAKGVDVIVDAFSILKNKYPNKYSLTIVGSGEEEFFLKKKNEISNLGINFLGHVDNRDILNSILRDHDIFCFASLSEGSPRVILEAIANGLNVVTTPVGSLPYIFKDEEELLYFDYNNKEKLAEKINYLANNTDIKNKLRENSFIKVKSFKIDNFIGEVFDA
ncbi:glycosyltransferase [Acinetobacter sp. ANC 3781]